MGSSSPGRLSSVALPLMLLGPVWIAPYIMQLAVVAKFHAALWFT